MQVDTDPEFQFEAEWTTTGAACVVSTSILWDQRNDAVAPWKGSLLSADVEVAGRDVFSSPRLEAGGSGVVVSTDLYGTTLVILRMRPASGDQSATRGERR